MTEQSPSAEILAEIEKIRKSVRFQQMIENMLISRILDLPPDRIIRVPVAYLQALILELREAHTST